MVSSLDKRTNLEYGFRPSVNPGESYQDFITQIPDQAIANQDVQKHSEFKKPYLSSDSYQNMDYQWYPNYPMPYPIQPLPSYPIPTPYEVPSPGDTPSYVIPSPTTVTRGLVPSPPDMPPLPPSYVPPQTTPVTNHPEDGPQYPVPSPPDAPVYPIPQIPFPNPPPVPSPPRPDQPPPTRTIVQDNKIRCCKGIKITGSGTVAKDTSATFSIDTIGISSSCRYQISAERGYVNLFQQTTGGGQVASFEYIAPSECGPDTLSVGVWGTFNLDANATCVKKVITITGCCDCESAHIDYTTQQMSVGQSQDLSVGTPSGGSTYTWSLAGGGSLSTTTGNSTTYTAPATNPDCAENATITLSCSAGDVCDILQIAINGVSGNDVVLVYSNARSTLCQLDYNPGGCPPPICNLENCAVDRNNYNCDGSAGTPLSSLIGQVSWCVGLPGTCQQVAGYDTLVNSPPVDSRTLAQKADGCCPAQLL